MPEIINTDLIRKVEMVKALEASMMGMFAAFDADPDCADYWPQVKEHFMLAHQSISNMEMIDIERRIWDELKKKHNIQRPSPITQVSMRDSIRR